MRHCIALLVCLLSIFALAQTPPASTPTESVSQVQAAAINALTFEQGNLRSLTKARTDFTPQGWDDFMKTLQGFLDDKGAPTYSSKFVPAGDAVVVNKDRGPSISRFPAPSRKLPERHEPPTICDLKD
jgi:hypothetical protein